MKRAAIYLRVSTSKQDTENQRRELEAVGARSSWQIVKVYEDAGVSGAKGRDKRPGLDAMLKAVNAKEFEIVAAWSVDRLGRSLTDLLGILQGLHDKGVDLFLHQQGLDTSTTAGKAMFQMLGVFAEFERGIIRERVNAGLARAKAKGTRLGRRPVEPTSEFVIRFGGRFVQPTKRGLCPVAEKANFQKSESDQPVARFDGENFRLNEKFDCRSWLTRRAGRAFGC